MLKTSLYDIGIDEAGRGPLFGRVYVAAVIWDGENIMINDSKKLSKKKRKIAFEYLKNLNIKYGIGWAGADEIDENNILQATKIALLRAIENLNIDLKNYTLLIDGSGWEKQLSDYNVKSIIKGDSKYYSIAAASIIAKEYHDEYIKNICNNDTELNIKYDLLNNMGYGTKTHINGIKKYGYSIYHRKSFIIKKIL
jgi:ribonuclease HII